METPGTRPPDSQWTGFRVGKFPVHLQRRNQGALPKETPERIPSPLDGLLWSCRPSGSVATPGQALDFVDCGRPQRGITAIQPFGLWGSMNRKNQRSSKLRGMNPVAIQCNRFSYPVINLFQICQPLRSQLFRRIS